MQYTTTYNSPIGRLLIACDSEGLTGLWTEDAKFFANGLDKDNEPKNTPVLKDTKRWLDIYFSKKKPDFTPSLHLIGTPFQLEVWKILQQIPYGQTKTYKEIAAVAAKNRGLPNMSAQAVGGAVGHNKILIIIPCHRVIGSHGNLTGYAAGLDKKAQLLKIENCIGNNKTLSKRVSS